MRLGKTQHAALAKLHEKKRWSRYCGWDLGTVSNTEKVLESLIKYGLVRAADEVISPAGCTFELRRRVYRPTGVEP